MTSVFLFSCSGDYEEVLADGSSNTTDVAVTSNVSKLGVTYAYIDGYVNLNLLTSSYTSQQIGVELSMSEEFNNAQQFYSKELEGNKLTVVIDTLSGNTKYFYRTFVKVNDIKFYGEKRSFTTKDFLNITSTGDASNLTFTSVKIDCKADANSLDRDNHFLIGVSYSLLKSQLHPDSIQLYRKYVICPLDSIKNKSYGVSISKLQTGKTYYYCSFTRAGNKYKLGEIRSFSTKSLTDSQLSTGDATDITFTSATINGTSTIADMYPKGTSITYGVRYALTKEALESGSYRSVKAVVNDNIFTTQLRDLTIGTTYYYYAFANVDGITLPGEIKQFTTKSGNSYISTGEATDLTFTSATINSTSTIADMYPKGTIITYGVRYALTKEALESGSYRSVKAVVDDIIFTSQLKDLTIGTTYYYYAFANVDGITITGEIKQFTTKSGNSYISTEEATSVTLTSATLNGKTTLSSLYSNKEITIRYTIRYSQNEKGINDKNGKTGNYETITPTLNGNDLSASLSHLQSNTTYYFCVVAYAEGYYICGDIKSFNTKAVTDYLKTETASDVTLFSATLKGSTSLSTIYPNTSSIMYSIRYATSKSNLESNYNCTSIDVIKNGNTLSGTATNLKSEMSYYYCIVAYVDERYFYGEVKEFTTKSGAEFLNADDASIITQNSATVKGTTSLASIYKDDSTILYSILYGTASNLKSSSDIVTPKLTGTTLTAELSGLIMTTTYYYCIRASVNGNYVYSDIKSFTTKDIQTTGYVDLGVSCKWATCNLGSMAPEEYGDYYAWGETESRTFFYSSNYKYNKDVGKDISGTHYDAASIVLGSPWRMPNMSEFQELLDKCFWQEITYKNTIGYLVTGKNGNAIFLPRTGCKYDNSIKSGYGIWTSTYYINNSQGSYAYYWCGSMLSYIERYYGLTIRPVKD